MLPACSFPLHPLPKQQSCSAMQKGRTVAPVHTHTATSIAKLPPARGSLITSAALVFPEAKHAGNPCSDGPATVDAFQEKGGGSHFLLNSCCCLPSLRSTSHSPWETRHDATGISQNRADQLTPKVFSCTQTRSFNANCALASV